MEALQALQRSVKFLGCFGLLPLTTKKSTEKLRFKVSRRRIIVAIATAIFSLAQFMHQTIYYLDYYENKTLAQYVIYIYWSTMNGITCMVAHLLAIKNHHKICKFCNKLAARLQEVSELTRKPPGINLTKYLTIGCISGLLVIIFDFDQWAWVNFGEYLIIILSMSVVLHLGTLHLIIASAVKELSLTFQKNLKCVQHDWLPENIRTRYVVEMIQRYCSVYHDLFELTQELTENFATVSLCFISHMFMIIIIATYSGLKDIEQSTEQEIVNWFVLVGWSIYGFTAIFLLIYPCATVMNQGIAVTEIVNKCLAKSKNVQITEQLMKFAMLLTYEKMVFTPHNLFSFTYGLIPTITGSSISYMIIMTQIDSADKNCTTL